MQMGVRKVESKISQQADALDGHVEVNSGVENPGLVESELLAAHAAVEPDQAGPATPRTWPVRIPCRNCG